MIIFTPYTNSNKKFGYIILALLLIFITFLSLCSTNPYTTPYTRTRCDSMVFVSFECLLDFPNKSLEKSMSTSMPCVPTVNLLNV